MPIGGPGLPLGSYQVPTNWRCWIMSFDVEAVLSGLISKEPEKFLYERTIRFFQFQTWIYFSDDERMVDAAGKLAAAAFMRKIERETAKKIPGIRRAVDVNSKVLIQLLNTRKYSRLYNEFFQEDGFTGLLRTFSVEEFNKNVATRSKEAETVSEMIDFRFRGLDYKTLDAKQFNISRSEFYRWYKHPSGPLSWKTIRTRWKESRDSAPFLYVSEKFDGIGIPDLTPSGLSQRYRRLFLTNKQFGSLSECLST